jgi:nitroimidazol reductase NimA-like FMN-containing flavoprotein (pyridoxamine 5'-phosphate oxidase superfamily)
VPSFEPEARYDRKGEQVKTRAHDPKDWPTKPYRDGTVKELHSLRRTVATTPPRSLSRPREAHPPTEEGPFASGEDGGDVVDSRRGGTCRGNNMTGILDEDYGSSFAFLGDDECWRLLRNTALGRVAVSMGAIPAIFPINYAVEAEAIYFLTGEGTKLHAAVRGAVLAFEIDHFDITYQRGWSVLAVGEAHVVEDGAALLTRLPLRPWAPGDRHHLVGINPDFLSGRRIAP